MKRILALFLTVVTISFSAISQPTITVGTIAGAVPGATILVPVSVSNFNGLGLESFTCSIAYDNTVLTYGTHQNLCPGFQDVFLATNATPTDISVAWFSVNTINYPNGQIFDLEFTYLGGSCALTWDPLCAGGGIIFNNGSVSGPLASIDSEIWTSSMFRIVPNPASDKISFTAVPKPLQILNVTLFNTTGQQIQGLMPLDKYQHEFDVSALSKGMYILRIQLDNEVVIRKMVIQ
ncbi:MAG: T9SS type A sorting domain-containing protein [Bacteroidetes bacterium]|nr:T9SS type A sorting domain-containing protein [Bacteroidota bacterium]